MTPKKGTFKRYNGSIWEDFYFKTSTDMVEGLSSALSTYVNKTGNETVGGMKSFSDGIVIPGANKYIDIGNKTNWFWTRFSGENWTFNNTYTGGGWARNLMEMKDNSEVAYFRIGAQGNAQTFSHMYIGPAYNNYWLSLNDTRADLKVQLDMNSKKITALATPTANTDAATKKYVDDSIPTLPTLATVATSGSYNDLSNKPTIPSIAGLVPDTRTINSKRLNANISLTASDVGAINNSTAETIDAVKTWRNSTWSSGSETLALKTMVRTGASQYGSISVVKEGPNSGIGLRFDQIDGTTRLMFRGSSTAGAMIWNQPETNSALYLDVDTVHLIKQRNILIQSGIIRPSTNNAGTLGNASYKWSNIYTTKINNGGDITVPSTSGTIALTSNLTNTIKETGWNSSTKVWTLEVQS